MAGVKIMSLSFLVAGVLKKRDKKKAKGGMQEECVAGFCFLFLSDEGPSQQKERAVVQPISAGQAL